jgi:hypothetical protein
VRPVVGDLALCAKAVGTSRTIATPNSILERQTMAMPQA